MDLSQYIRPALQFSGGKDSLACLYLLRENLHNLPVYWLNTGDGFDETLAVVQQVRSWVPHFIEVKSDVKSWKKAYGTPSDITPANGHILGVAYGLGEQKVSGRFDCCYHNLMVPMHDRMQADGVDAVIRGTKRSDTGKLPAEGPTGFYDVLLPLRDWTHEQVFSYLKSVGAPENELYEHFHGASAPECLGCTAWWGEGKSAYMAKRHPEKQDEYRSSLLNIQRMLQAHLADLQIELRSDV